MKEINRFIENHIVILRVIVIVLLIANTALFFLSCLYPQLYSWLVLISLSLIGVFFCKLLSRWALLAIPFMLVYYSLINWGTALITAHLLKNRKCEIEVVRNLHHTNGSDPIYYVYVDKKVSAYYTDRKSYQKLKIGDTIIMMYSIKHPNINEFQALTPSHEKIERHKVPQHYVNGKLQEKPSYEQYSAAVRDSVLRHSHKQVGYVYEKTDDEYYRHLVKVGIDAEHTTTHEFYETDRNYTKVYKRLHVGDAVILQVADSLPEINRVLCWQPDGNDIANYATYEAIKDYSNCSKEFETEKLLNSHNRKAIVYDKYEDEHVGAYLEVGIDEKHVRTYMFKTYSKEFKQIYQVVNVGDMVIAQVSDEIPQLNRVVNWQTTIDGEKGNHLQDEYTYVTIANVKSKKTREEYLGRSYRKGTFYYVKLKIGNKIETNYVKIKSTRHRQIFESLHEGDSVLVKMTEGKTKTVRVLNWQPTREEIEKYKRSVRLIE